MGQVADILTSPEWTKKSDVEKARAQRDLFEISLRDNPDYASQFGAADDAGKQKLVDDWKHQIRQQFPEAFTADGTVWTQEEGSKGLLYPKRVPVQLADVDTEEFIDRVRRDPKARDEAIAQANALTDPEQKKQMQMLLASRLELGEVPSELIHTGKPGKPYGGKLADGSPDPADYRNYPVLLPAALRTGGAIAGGVAGTAAGVESGPGAIATGAAGRAIGGFVGDAAAQLVEKALGMRESYSKGEAAINTLVSALPPIPLPKGAGAVVRAGVRGAEGAAIGAGQEAATEAVRGEKLSLPNIATAGAAGLGLGGLIGAFEPKIAALIAGKSKDEAIATLKAAAEKAPEADRGALTAAQKQIEDSLHIGEQPKDAAASALELSKENPPVVKSAQSSPEAMAPQLAANEQRAGDFEKARVEEAGQVIKDNQLAGEESIMLGDNPAKNQQAALDTRSGEAAAERARIDEKLSAETPQVDDGSLSDGVQLSPQAQAIYDQHGFISRELSSGLAGGTAGFAYGASRDPEGDTAQERAVNRIKTGLVVGVAGAAGGYMLGRRFLASNGATPPKPGMSVLEEVDRVLTKPDGPSVLSRAADLPGSIRSALVTKFAPLDAVEKQVMSAAGKPVPVLPLSRKFEQVAGASGKAMVDVQDFENAILPAVKGNERDFDRLLFLKRTGQRLQQDLNDSVEASRIQAVPPGSRTPDETAFLASHVPNRRRVAGWDIGKVDRGLAELEGAVGSKRFAELDQVAAGAFQQQLDRNLRLQLSSGRISQEAYDAVKASNDFYAPFRVLQVLDEIDSGRMPAGVDTRAQIVKAITGIDDGQFHLDSPTKAAAENIFNGRVLAEKNLKMLELARLADDDPTGTFVRKLKSWQSPRKGFEAVNYFDNGAAMRLEVAPDVAAAVKGLNPTQSGIVSDMFRRAGAVARFGTTSANLAFQVRNIAFADQPRLLLMSKYGLNAGDVKNPLRVPIDFTHALLSSIKSNVLGADDSLARSFYESGAAGSTLQDSISRLGGRFDAPPGIAHQILDKFEDVTRVLEETTKMMGFKRAVRLEGLDKLPPAQAAKKLEEVVTEIRNYAGSPDFARGGAVAKDLSMLTLFFNARVQGTVSDLSRLAGADGARTALGAWGRIGAAVGIPSAYFWIRNHAAENADDFKKVPQWERDNYAMIPRYDEAGAPLYFTNGQGEKLREYWRLPKRESVQHIANLTDAALDFADSRDSKAVADFAAKFAENVSPINVSGRSGTERLESAASGLNPVAKLPAEVMTNRDFFRHREIVPDGRNNASPENQYYAGSTPQAYVDAAHKMPQWAWDPLRSPLMLRHIVGGVTGGLVNQFAPDTTRKGERDPATAKLSANPVGRIFVRSQTNDTEEEGGMAREALRGARDRSVSLDNAAASELDNLSKLSPAEKEARVRELDKSNPQLIDAIADEADARAKNLTQTDRLAKQMPIRDGTRARYIVERFKRLPIDKREQFLRDQSEKGIVTDDVLDQVAELMGAGKN